MAFLLVVDKFGQNIEFPLVYLTKSGEKSCAAENYIGFLWYQNMVNDILLDQYHLAHIDKVRGGKTVKIYTARRRE